MIILKKKHDEIVKQEYKKGFEAGVVSATDVLEDEFKVKLDNLNWLNNEISDENIELHSNILNLNKTIEEKNKTINELFEYSKALESKILNYKEENFEKDKKVEILKFFLRCNYNKDVARYEAIAKRTKKVRIKEKAEKKILDLKELALAFE